MNYAHTKIVFALSSFLIAFASVNEELPNIGKVSWFDANHFYLVGVSQMQGWRKTMEDAECQYLHLLNDPHAALFGVFDGHAGDRVAHYAAAHIYTKITESPDYQKRPKKAIHEAFLALDKEMSGNREIFESKSGSTANVVLIKDNNIFCGNAGDSRAVLCVRGRAVELSKDHRPNNEAERKRIEKAGGRVIRDKFVSRMKRDLTVSRALGDFRYKEKERKTPSEQIIIADPEIMTHAIDAETEFFVIASDGVWDVMSSQEVVDFCRENLEAEMSPRRVRQRNNI